jgi:DNA-binding MarR family transcriptional regulator
LARKPSAARDPLDQAEYETLAAFRYMLRQFLAFSDRASAEVGLTQQQYQALLALRAHDGPVPLSMTGLAGLLLVKHHSAVGMVNRLARLGLVRREPSTEDRRKVGVRLTARGERVFGELAAVHRAELRRIGRDLGRFGQFLARPGAARADSSTRKQGRAKAA